MQNVRPWSVSILLFAAGCRPSSSVDGDVPDVGAAEVSAPAEGDISLWVGLHCRVLDEGSGAATTHEFSFYVDGVEAQRWESPCVGYTAPGEAPPNGGQFELSMEPGIHVMRFQDDTIDAFSEERVQLSRNSWMFVHHRVLDAGGYMLSFDVRDTAPLFVAQ